jgi:hypothetical protein
MADLDLAHDPAIGGFAPVPTGGFDADTIRLLTAAFEEAWSSLHSNGLRFRSEADTRDLLAQAVIQLAGQGERDRGRLRDGALAHLAQTHLRSSSI